MCFDPIFSPYIELNRDTRSTILPYKKSRHHTIDKRGRNESTQTKTKLDEAIKKRKSDTYKRQIILKNGIGTAVSEWCWLIDLLHIFSEVFSFWPIWQHEFKKNGFQNILSMLRLAILNLRRKNLWLRMR